MEKYRDSIRRYGYCFFLGPFFMVIEACGEFILPYLNANMIDRGAALGDISYILKNGFYMLLTALVMLAAGVLGAFLRLRGLLIWQRMCGRKPLPVFRSFLLPILTPFPPVL